MVIPANFETIFVCSYLKCCADCRPEWQTKKGDSTPHLLFHAVTPSISSILRDLLALPPSLSYSCRISQVFHRTPLSYVLYGFCWT